MYGWFSHSSREGWISIHHLVMVWQPKEESTIRSDKYKELISKMKKSELIHVLLRYIFAYSG